MDSSGNAEKNTLLIDIATRDVIHFAPGDSVGEAARVMAEKRISSIAVTDEEGRPAGIVTERNILHAMQGGCSTGLKLADIMSSPVITVPSSISALDAYQLCLHHAIRHLVIVSEGGVVEGVASETDFRRHLNLTVLAGRRRVASIAHRSAVVLPPSTSLQQALDLMLAQRKSCVIVAENERPVGIMTERDVVRFYAGGKGYADIALGEVMVSPVLTIEQEATTSQAAEKMLVHKVRHLVVVDEAGLMAGLVSEHDLAQAMVTGLTEERDGVEENFLRTLVNTLPDLVWLKDANGIYLACNARFEEFFGARERDIIGKTDYDFVDKELADSFREHDCHAMEKDGPSINEELLTFRLGGYQGVFETIKTPMRDRNGGLIGVLGIAREITTRKRLEERLERSERKLHDIYDSVSDCIEIISEDGRILEMNRAGYERLGYTRDEMVGRRLSEFTAPGYTERVAERMAQIKRDGHGAFESGRLRMDGTVMPLEVRSRLIELDGQPVFLGISRDITERKRAEAELHDSHAKLSSLYSLSPMGIALTDMQGHYIEFNDAFRDICGYTREELNRLDYWELTPREYAEQEAAQLESLKARGYYGPYEKEYIRKDGVRVPLRLNGVLIHGSDGRPYIWSIVEDITEQRRAEEMLRKLSAAVEQSAAAVVITDLEARIQYVNPRFTEATGYDADEVIGQNPRILQSEQTPQETYREMWARLTGGQEWRGELLNRRKNGELYWEEVSISPIRNAEGVTTHYVGIKTDITERKRMGAALTESELRYRSLVENSPFCIHEIDLEGRLQSMNRAGLEMLGLDGEAQIRGLPYLNAVSEQDGGRIAELLRQAVGGAASHFEFTSAGDMPRRFRSCFIPIRDVDGSVVKLMGITEDITEHKQAENALREREEIFSSIVNQAADSVVLIDSETLGMVEFNQKAHEGLGYTREEFARLTLVDVQAQMQEDEIRRRMSLAVDAGQTLSFETLHRRKDGSVRETRVSSGAVTIRDRKYLSSIWTDITERKQAENALRVTASVFDTSQEAIVITDADNAIIDVNPAFERITGYAREEVLGRNPKLLSSGRKDQAFYAAMWQSLEQNKSWRGEIWNRRKSGELYAELLSISVVSDDAGKVLRYVGVFSDISHLKKHEAELSRAAHYDALTGIPNRVLLADRMKQGIAQTAREQEMMAVCYLDLDGFKPVNDMLGHEAGDQVLVEIARRIGSTIRGGDTVARLGGDEFVVLLLGLERGEECVTTLERLLAAVAQPIDVKDTQISLGTSIGVSIYPLDDEDPDILLRHADQAMYVAKHSGKNRFYIYDASLDQRTRSHHEFQQSIHFGLELGQFELYYQPKINLATKEMVGVEALIRWRHQERGLLLPMEFLRSVENTQLEIEIGDWVIATALAQLDSWHGMGLDVEISINISANHLESPRFVEKLQERLAQYPAVQPSLLQIEVLETAALNDLVAVRKIINECRKMGVSFALDDFGTGYSSLSYLSSLPVDVLKIDQSFVHDMLDDKGDRAIVQGIIALARAFDRRTVGEGIETPEHYQALLDLGCELGQGYGIARPMPADELVKWKAE